MNNKRLKNNNNQRNDNFRLNYRMSKNTFIIIELYACLIKILRNFGKFE